jgi:hypothetical protein
MYLARFVAGAEGLVSAALKWPALSGALVPGPWIRNLLLRGNLRIALRVKSVCGAIEVVLVLSAKARAEDELRARCHTLLGEGAPAGLMVPAGPGDYDAMTGAVPAWQVRVQHDQFHHRGHAIACHFRLYSGLARDLAELWPCSYQVHLRPHRPDVALERQARKHLAWLEIERPFSEAVRGAQRNMVLQLMNPGWLAAEYLAFDTVEDGECWLGQMRLHFAETTGRLGFAEVPLEVGDFRDWLVTGAHPADEAGPPSTLPAHAASIFSDDEIPWLLTGAFARRRERAAPGLTPAVFISYASEDFGQASTICATLEAAGIGCWIAPRDIDSQPLPYPEAIRLGLSRASAVVVIVSEAANLSVHVPRELDLALSRKLTIIPVRVENVAPRGQLDYLLRTCQWLDAYDRGREAIAQELLGRLPGHGHGPGRTTETAAT